VEHRTALSFMAHPDDAEILCAGTLTRLREAGWTVHIATLTAGDCGSMTEDRWQISATRTREALAAAACIGASYHCLDERDGLVVYDKPTLQKCFDFFRRITPSLVITHPPVDYMMDHQVVSMLAQGASFMYDCPNCSVVPRQPHSRIPHLYFADPVGAMDAPAAARIEPTTLIDVSPQLEGKSRMLACHASQREWLRAHHGMDEYIDAMRRHAAARGVQAGVAAAEAFVQHRGHAYPADDLLQRILPRQGSSTASSTHLGAR
jgi:LmbE family N-acetylglucosaminyl deacetylase